MLHLCKSVGGVQAGWLISASGASEFCLYCREPDSNVFCLSAPVRGITGESTQICFQQAMHEHAPYMQAHCICKSGP